MMAPLPNQHYAHVMRRLTPLGAWCGLAIQVLTIASLWSHPKLVWISVGGFAVLIVGNVVFTFVLLKRFPTAHVELVRIVMNNLATLLINHATGWPLPVWFWLPFQGLAYDGHRRVNWTQALVPCGCAIAGGLYDGVPWLIPVTFTVFAIIARLLTDARQAVLREMFERTEAQQRALEQVERELRQSQKLEAIGRLAAGVAHEINTPLQFVGDSVQFLTEGVDEVLALGTAHATTPEELDALGYLRANMPEALQLAKDGLGRVTTIVSSLRDFAHPETAKAAVDVNRAVRSAIAIARHEFRYVAKLETSLAELPTVTANASEINQVIVNLIVNAAHAIAERYGKDAARGTITVTTGLEAESAVISIQDNGAGIPQDAHDKIFEPFFTTKDIGKGTGQGLAIARAIAERHSGSLTFTSKCGTGSTFTLRLPIDERVIHPVSSVVPESSRVSALSSINSLAR